MGNSHMTYIIWAYDNVTRMINAIGRQASALLGFNGTMMTIILAFTRVFDNLQNGFLVVLIIAATILFLASALLCAFLAILTTGWAHPVPAIKQQRGASTSEKDEETAIVESLKWNIRFLEKYGLILICSLLMTSSGIILLAYVVMEILLFHR